MKETLFKRKQLVVEKFVKAPINWPNEMRLLGQLLSGYSLEFLEFFVLGYQVKSLNSFKYERIQEPLVKEKKKFDIINEEAAPKFECNDDTEYEPVFKKEKTLKDKLGL